MNFFSRFCLMLGLSLGLLSSVARAEKPVNTTFFGKLALHGYDAVSYFDASPRKGVQEFSHEWMGARWLFASAANRDAFAAQPEKFAPQFGGYCAWAVSEGYTADIDPLAWDIVEGRLYLNYNREVQAKWRAERLERIPRGRVNWEKISK